MMPFRIIVKIRAHACRILSTLPEALNIQVTRQVLALSLLHHQHIKSDFGASMWVFDDGLIIVSINS